MRRFELRVVPIVLGALSLTACRNSTDQSSSSFLTLVPSAAGANGCSGPNQSFTPTPVPVALTLTTFATAPTAQVTASGASELLFATGANATITQINVSGATPAELALVSAGTVATLLAGAGIVAAPALSGIAVLDASHLVVIENTSNTLLIVDRATPNHVAFYAGAPNIVPGFANGLALGPGRQARFSFDGVAQICPTGGASPDVLVCDVGNHALRAVALDPSSGLRIVTTLCGSGTSGFSDGSLSSASFDAPSGVSLACSGLVILSEKGGDGFGQRLRRIEITSPNPFGGFFGNASTLVGNGTAATTAGNGSAAEVDAPLSPLVSAGGEIYWIDSGSGVLRRWKLNGAVDCPLASDCATAVSTPSFPAGHAFSLTQTPLGKLFVLDATAGVLWRVNP